VVRLRFLAVGVTGRASREGAPGGGGGEEDAVEPAGFGLKSTTCVLIDRIKAGDAQARETLAARYRPRLLRLASLFLPADARRLVDPEDIVQETLLRTFKSIEKFTPVREGAFFLYVRQILQHVIFDVGRGAKRRPPAAAMESEPVDPGPSTVELVIGREQWEVYRKAVERLNERQKEAVVLFVEAGFDLGEIARAIEASSEAAARMVVYRGLRRLAELMHVERDS
jgi:RNA polymerase sigma factor (sigma-70 family)